MALGGLISNGTKIGFSLSSPVSYTKIAQILMAPEPGIERESVDSTVHGTSIITRALPGMATVDGLSMTLLADPNPSTGASHESLRTYLLSGTTLWWRIEVPSDRTQSAYRAFEFQAWIKAWRMKPADPKGRIEIECTLEFDGDSWTSYNPGASVLG